MLSLFGKLLFTGFQVLAIKYFAFRNKYVVRLRRQLKKNKNEDKEIHVATYSFWEVSISSCEHSSYINTLYPVILVLVEEHIIWAYSNSTTSVHGAKKLCDSELFVLYCVMLGDNLQLPEALRLLLVAYCTPDHVRALERVLIIMMESKISVQCLARIWHWQEYVVGQFFLLATFSACGAF